MPNGTEKKRWLVVLPVNQRDWIKDISSSTGLKGSDIMSELIEDCMKNNSAKFKQSLAQTQLKIKLQAINERRAALEEEAQEVKRSLGGSLTREKVLA